MKSVVRECTKQLKQLAAPYGFHQKGAIFWRLVNDMFQLFHVESINLFLGTKLCRVGFFICPLCRGVDAEQDIRKLGYYLKGFEPSPNENRDGWEYTVETTSRTQCCSEVLRFAKQYMMPFFVRTESSEYALDELIKFERMRDENRRSTLQHGPISRGGSGQEARLLMCDARKFCLAIKSGKYEFAEQVMESLIENEMKLYEREKKQNMGKHPTECEEKLRKYQTMFERTKARDAQYFQQLFVETEERSKKTFASLS